MASLGHKELTHWGRVTHICVSKLTIIGSDNGLSPVRRQAIIWTNAGILLTGPLGTNFSEILIEIHTFSFKKMRLKVSSAEWRPCCLGLQNTPLILNGECGVPLSRTFENRYREISRGTALLLGVPKPPYIGVCPAQKASNNAKRIKSTNRTVMFVGHHSHESKPQMCDIKNPRVQVQESKSISSTQQQNSLIYR